MPILSMPYSANNLHWNITLERVRPEGRTFFYRYRLYEVREAMKAEQPALGLTIESADT